MCSLLLVCSIGGGSGSISSESCEAISNELRLEGKGEPCLGEPLITLEVIDIGESRFLEGGETLRAREGPGLPGGEKHTPTLGLGLGERLSVTDSSPYVIVNT